VQRSIGQKWAETPLSWAEVGRNSVRSPADTPALLVCPKVNCLKNVMLVEMADRLAEALLCVGAVVAVQWGVDPVCPARFLKRGQCQALLLGVAAQGFDGPVSPPQSSFVVPRRHGCRRSGHAFARFNPSGSGRPRRCLDCVG